jgi:hypothetical protein
MYLSLLLPDVHVFMGFMLPGFDRRDAPRQSVGSVKHGQAVRTVLSADGHVSLPPLA